LHSTFWRRHDDIAFGRHSPAERLSRDVRRRNYDAVWRAYPGGADRMLLLVEYFEQAVPDLHHGSPQIRRIGSRRVKSTGRVRRYRAPLRLSPADRHSRAGRSRCRNETRSLGSEPASHSSVGATGTAQTRTLPWGGGSAPDSF